MNNDTNTQLEKGANSSFLILMFNGVRKIWVKRDKVFYKFTHAIKRTIRQHCTFNFHNQSKLAVHV